MWRLASILNLFIGSTMAGTGVIVALVMGHDGMKGVLTGAVAGFVLSLPVTYLIARQLWETR